MKKMTQSLSTKLSMGILLMAVLVFVVSLGILFVQSRHNIKKEAEERVSSALTNALERVNRQLITVETATNANDWLVVDDFQPQKLLDVSRFIVMFNSYVNGCSITVEPGLFPEYGRYFSAYSLRQGDSVMTVREAEYEYFDKVWYKTPVMEGRACWVDPFNGYNEGTLSAEEMIASYCKPLYDANGQLLCVISTDLSLPKLSATIQSEVPYPNSYFVMLGKEGQIFIYPDSTRIDGENIFTIEEARNDSKVKAVGHEMTAGHEGVSTLIIGGEPCMVSYKPVRGTQWSLALVCPESEILRHYNHLTYIVIPLLAVGLLFILLFCQRIVGHAISPLNMLVHQLQSISEGDYSHPISHTQRPDVVGRLQNSFATMQESLNQHIGNLNEMNQQAANHNEELAIASQLAEDAGRQKTAFIQNVTHQIRTPLNIIMGFAQVLRESITMLSIDEAKNITTVMDQNAKTLARMVLMLYDSSDTGIAEELHNRQRELVSCNEIVRECINWMMQRFPGLEIAFSTTLSDIVCIATNRMYLERSLRELLYNAAKYSDKQNISVHVTESEFAVRFVFQDTGPGISKSYLAHLYTPFFKEDDLSEGLGLGLPLTMRHCKNLGGSLMLDPDYHEGCRFIVEFPKAS